MSGHAHASALHLRWHMGPGYLAVLVILLGTAASIGAMHADAAVFRAIQVYSHVVPDALFAAFWQSATFAGDGLAAVALCAILVLVRPPAVWAALVGLAPATLLLRAGKILLAVERPALVLAQEHITVLGPVLHHGSFPSGHSMAAGLLAGVVVLAAPPGREARGRRAALRVVVCALAVLVALSRVAVGAHWPTDVAAGLSIGWLCAWIGWTVVAHAQWPRAPQLRALAAVIVIVCAGLLFGMPMGLPAATPFRYTLALVAIVLALVALARAARDWRQPVQRPDLPAGFDGTERPRPGSRSG
jgi:membrane-associated phospholipid phosphatase